MPGSNLLGGGGNIPQAQKIKVGGITYEISGGSPSSVSYSPPSSFWNSLKKLVTGADYAETGAVREQQVEAAKVAYKIYAQINGVTPKIEISELANSHQASIMEEARQEAFKDTLKPPAIEFSQEVRKVHKNAIDILTLPDEKTIKAQADKTISNKPKGSDLSDADIQRIATTTRVQTPAPAINTKTPNPIPIATPAPITPARHRSASLGGGPAATTTPPAAGATPLTSGAPKTPATTRPRSQSDAGLPLSSPSQREALSRAKSNGGTSPQQPSAELSREYKDHLTSIQTKEASIQRLKKSQDGLFTGLSSPADTSRIFASEAYKVTQKIIDETQEAINWHKSKIAELDAKATPTNPLPHTGSGSVTSTAGTTPSSALSSANTPHVTTPESPTASSAVTGKKEKDQQDLFATPREQKGVFEDTPDSSSPGPREGKRATSRAGIQGLASLTGVTESAPPHATPLAKTRISDRDHPLSRSEPNSPATTPTERTPLLGDSNSPKASDASNGVDPKTHAVNFHPSPRSRLTASPHQPFSATGQGQATESKEASPQQAPPQPTATPTSRGPGRSGRVS